MAHKGLSTHPASAFALPASRLDLVQGTAQKIHLQYLLGQSLSTAPLPPPAPSPAAGPFAASPDPAAPATAPVSDDPLPTPMPLPLNSLLPGPSPPPPAKTAARVSWPLLNSPLAAPFLLSGDIISVSFSGCRTLIYVSMG
jgi:hypothetical protein